MYFNNRWLILDSLDLVTELQENLCKKVYGGKEKKNRTLFTSAYNASISNYYC